MKRCRQTKSTGGVTLLELVCVISIIMVLASLLLGPAARVLQRVLADKWAEEAELSLASTVQQLNQHFQGLDSFALVTIDSIEAQGLLKPTGLRFLKDRRVTFLPFAGSDSNDKIVIRVQIKRGFWTERSELTERKETITRVPN